ncbi:hypothetical protein [Propionivibrio dicarboxylicus]|uniref:Uncharacterized protein n=1 Tax=Propionivibrio dicarboxylicus TaxID=83767 RepID=A0A1G8LIX8_9RHOO|nr:hypothetical protein [Propionivibrio dicarboxylicus]SDI55631.1 hypothetical protein SAMN05660652_03654 [Propionivibrio dicarboxylicus]
MKWTTSVACLLLGVGVSIVSQADQARPPQDYVMAVAGGKYALVMLAERSPGLLDPGSPDDVGIVEKKSEIRARYPQSGLYAGDSKTPLWTFSWYAFTVHPSSDGDHLVRMGPWASSVDQLALAFYSRGELIKEYRIRDLVVDADKLKRTVSHFFWVAEQGLDDRRKRFHVKTTDGQEYTFSILTGLPID